MITPTSMPTMPQTTVIIANCRTTLSLYVYFVAVIVEFIECTSLERQIIRVHRTFLATFGRYVIAAGADGFYREIALRVACTANSDMRASADHVPTLDELPQHHRPTLVRDSRIVRTA